MQHTATHCRNGIDRARHWISDWLQHTATCYNTLQHAATRCNALQRTATHCRKRIDKARHWISDWLQHAATRCNTLQHAATHCNTLRHTAGTEIIEIDIGSLTDLNVWEKMVLAWREALQLGVLQCASVRCSMMQCSAVWRSVLQCLAVCCSVFQCVAVCCSVLQCVAVCCLWCAVGVAVYCRVLQCVAAQGSAGWCWVLQCVAVCCIVLPCVTMCYRTRFSHWPEADLSGSIAKMHTPDFFKNASSDKLSCLVLLCACILGGANLHKIGV